MNPIAYKGITSDDSAVFMTPDNTPPALIVWLYLVTFQEFNNQLATATSAAGVTFDDKHGKTATVTQIAAVTGFSAETVTAILDAAYYSADPDPATRAKIRAAFNTVAQQFQLVSSRAVDPTQWQPGECPGIYGINLLATRGAKPAAVESE